MKTDTTRPIQSAQLGTHPFRREVYFVMNRDSNTAAIFEASCFEELQMMFRVGIALPDGTLANGIGRCANAVQFAIKASRGGTRVQSYDDDCRAVHACQASTDSPKPKQEQDTFRR